MRRYLGLVMSTALIIAVVVPWAGFQDHPHWQKVGWIPFLSPPWRMRDVVANMVLFAPFGLAVASHSAPSRILVNVALGSAGLSLLVETTQVYSHSRFPSATDVAANVLGALSAATVIRARRRVWD